MSENCENSLSSDIAQRSLLWRGSKTDHDFNDNISVTLKVRLIS